MTLSHFRDDIFSLFDKSLDNIPMVFLNNNKNVMVGGYQNYKIYVISIEQNKVVY